MANATVKGGFFETNGVGTLTQMTGTHSIRRRARQALAKYSTMSLRERIRALTGVAPGQSANKTLTRVAASEELGGKRATEVNTIINRNTTAADETEIEQAFLPLSTLTYDPTPVDNRDGNPLGTR